MALNDSWSRMLVELEEEGWVWGEEGWGEDGNR